MPLRGRPADRLRPPGTYRMSASSPALRASIVINNHNYARYLSEAIDSALRQTYPNVQVVVVDDGSTDDSPAIIASYGKRVVPILKENGGQTSAINVGVAAAEGDFVILLDGDDYLLPAAAESVAPWFATGRASRVFWPLVVVEADGSATGRLVPDSLPPVGDLRDIIRHGNPELVCFVPTSGNAWDRAFLDT